MSKKDFEVIALALRDERVRALRSLDTTKHAVIGKVSVAIADALEDNYPRFDRDKFLEATHV
jgi:hypothetical protein